MGDTVVETPGLGVAVLGAAGRMGQAVCRAVAADPALRLVAAVDPSHAGQPVLSGPIAGPDAARLGAMVISSSLDEVITAGAQVAVDFTRPAACRENLAFCARNGVHAVVGTSGFSEADHHEIAGWFDTANCLIVPNFAIGAVLMIRFAELAAPWFETAEIIELHHDNKVDAPSGTAVGTAERMAAASPDWAADPTRHETIPGARGAKGPADIPIHSVRMRGMVAHQEVLLGSEGQTLLLRHDSYDRSSFMPGVILAVKAVPDLVGLTVGLDRVLGL